MSYSEGPDKGHAWVIAIAACVLTMILSGLSKVVGILYVAVIDTYGATRFEATLPFSLRKSLRSLAGPVVGVIGQRYGIRTVTFFGGFVGALGAALCFIAPNTTWLVVCWGGIHGLGDAFSNTLFQVVVNQYFVKYRATASGIALSGACVGSIGFSFLIESLEDAYGLQGTFLIVSGVILHVLPAAILLKSPSWIQNENQKNSIRQKPHSCVISKSCMKAKSIISLNPLAEGNNIFTISGLPMKTHSSTNLISTLQETLEETKGFGNPVFELEMQNCLEQTHRGKRQSLQSLLVTPEDCFCDHISLPCEKKNEVSRGTEEAKTGTEKAKSMLESVKSIARIYKNPLFVLICICMATYVLIVVPLMTTVIDYSRDKGLPETVGKYLIHATAVGDILGRLCFGWVTDKDIISIPHYMIIALVLEGIFILLLPMTKSLAMYLLLLALFSMTAGSMLVRLPILVFKHVKKEEHLMAMGCYGFVSGLIPLGIPSLIGYFRDTRSSYDEMYYILGGLSIVSGGLWLLEPALARLNDRLQQLKKESNSV
ncbi:monocarboxylate transporter 9-like [Stegodyphus dumicola]|uniref:monocarboxylate transporter 9-like n=1 Tax=Stegodyphus dumicola TaxID=202533 RepID=UPI0015ADC140|nr:monocarboxylate transporter 9-like [Stegodyphus dumicola]